MNGLKFDMDRTLTCLNDMGGFHNSNLTHTPTLFHHKFIIEGLYGNPRNTHLTSRFHAPNGLLEYYNITRSRTIEIIKSLIFGFSFNEHSLWWSFILCTKKKHSLRQPISQP
jgi:hypothetical protein